MKDAEGWLGRLEAALSPVETDASVQACSPSNGLYLPGVGTKQRPSGPGMVGGSVFMGTSRPQADFHSLWANKLNMKQGQIDNGIQQQVPINKWWMNSDILSQGGKSSCDLQNSNIWRSRKSWTDVLSDPGDMRDKIIKVGSKSLTQDQEGVRSSTNISSLMEQRDRKRQKLSSAPKVPK
eukprot:TRINITY_DN38594_c0_g1_i3.p2 TRINITY_DN38594_c0_g1~~TRINITY_DN38594_c0_g1_i3.p2  ORF type:complete len:180 (-),score=24.36 TRINITY_DN38594_c0_g1_i3:285-824(-)